MRTPNLIGSPYFEEFGGAKFRYGLERLPAPQMKWRWRFILAWAVFTGRYDALVWRPNRSLSR